MTGVEQLVVWLFGEFCARIAVAGAAKSLAEAKVGAAEKHAEAYVDAHRVVVEAHRGPVIVPPEWSEEGQ